MWRNKFLRWYRDQGNGQNAADSLMAEQTFDGSWPIARLHFTTEREREVLWRQLYECYGVNATSVYSH